MDARADIKGRLPSRHETEACQRTPHRYLRAKDLSGKDLSGGSINAALHSPAFANECEINLFEVAEIFKKTPCVAGLKLPGRYLAKDMDDVGGIPLLMTTLLDNGHLDGDCITATGRTITENLKSVKPGAVVCPEGNLAPEGAVFEVAGMLQDGDIIEIGGEARTLDVKLSAAEFAEHETKWLPRATNHASGALWKYAQEVGPAVDGAVTHPGAAHEKQCYADI
jgi:dihydroxyacid dehydratase/phosphogluconate dehydratase